MSNNIFNPLFPLNEYVPDGEPHVFENRVYVYGSHDLENGDRFCMDDYTVYSASIDDLSHWMSHGVSYKKSQDPRSKEGKLVDLYAPDCVQGNDGKFYLYYVAMGPNVKNFGPISVAVSDTPEGPFNYLDDVKYKNGSPLLKFANNDPAVLNDNGRIWMYYGWGLGRDFRSKLFRPIYQMVLSKILKRTKQEIKTTKPSILSCAIVELESDMLTVKSEPKAVLDSKTTADKSGILYQHPFYEAPSIRKFGDLYFLVYSSGENHELAYATSIYPDKGFTYRGVIISNSDLGYKGNTQPKAAGGTIHGGIECINGNYYVFYHRCTNNTNFSRQACAEHIELLPDGTIEQVEMTTQGISNKPIAAKGRFQASICCNLYNKKTNHVQGNGHGNDKPNIAFDGKDHFIRAIDHGTIIGYKYFDFKDISKIKMTIRGASGTIAISTKEDSALVATIHLRESTNWTEYAAYLNVSDGKHALFFTYHGKGKIDFLSFELIVGVKHENSH